MSTIAKVEAVVVMADGTVYDVNTVNPSPGGGNPRFVSHQLATGLKTLHGRLDRILEADWGTQEPRVPPVPPVHHPRLIRARLGAVVPFHRDGVDPDRERLLDELAVVVEGMLVEARTEALS